MNIGYGHYLLREHNWKASYNQQCTDIDKAIERGQLLIYLFEDIASYKGEFISIMHYLKDKQDSGLIKVMTLSEYWENLNLTTVINKGKSETDLNFSLEQNYPNPFNPSTKINYNLPSGSLVKLNVYNILGQEVEILFYGFQNAGKHYEIFNAHNLPSGIYFYRLETRRFNYYKKNDPYKIAVIICFTKQIFFYEFLT